MNNLDIGRLQSLWYSGGGNTGIGTFVQEMDRILMQIKNNISSVEKGGKLSANDILSMYYIPASTNLDIHTLYSFWYYCGGDTRLSIFIAEVNRILICIADNISKIDRRDTMGDVRKFNYDSKYLPLLWCSGCGSENLESTFVCELNNMINKIADDLDYLIVFNNSQ
jgi:hypothetical protein